MHGKNLFLSPFAPPFFQPFPSSVLLQAIVVFFFVPSSPVSPVILQTFPPPPSVFACRPRTRTDLSFPRICVVCCHAINFDLRKGRSINFRSAWQHQLFWGKDSAKNDPPGILRHLGKGLNCTENVELSSLRKQ